MVSPTKTLKDFHIILSWDNNYVTDGCGETNYPFNEEHEVFVRWPETEISQTAELTCPCGSFNASVYGDRSITRTCGGSYTFGAQWQQTVDISVCEFTNQTLELCNITTVST